DRARHSRFDAPATVRVSMSRPAGGDEVTLHLVNYNRTEPPGKGNAGRGIVDEKPIAVEKVAADILLPPGRRVVKVEAMTPEDPEPVAIESQVREGRVRFAVPRFLVYSVVRIYLSR